MYGVWNCVKTCAYANSLRFPNGSVESRAEVSRHNLSEPTIGGISAEQLILESVLIMVKSYVLSTFLTFEDIKKKSHV